MVSLRVVPWIDYDEFETVHRWLYSDSSEEAQNGVDRVTAWSSRGRLPPAIESTAALIQLRLRDCGFSGISQKELRHMYSLALIRFVNGLVDPLQKSKHAHATAEIAARMGLPLWFVELRHASTHEHLPGISVLREAAEQALQWLYDSYWALELKPEGVSILDESKLHSIRLALKRYKDARKAYIKESKRGKATSTDHEAALKKFIKAVSAPYLRDGVIPELLKPGGLVPLSKKKRPTFDDMSLSNDLLNLWIPLLRELDQQFPDFGKELIDIVVKRLDVREEYKINSELAYLVSETQDGTADDDLTGSSYLLTLACYLKHIVTNDFSGEEGTEAILESVELNDILEGCLRHPNHFTRAVLRNVYQVSDDRQQQDLEPFLRYIDSYLASKHSINASDDMEDIDMQGELSELNDRIKEMQGIVVDSDDMDENIASSSAWKLYDSSKWSACPIGCLPNGHVPSLYLDVPQE